MSANEIATRRILKQELVIPPTDGTEIISKATKVFTGYIDPDFCEWGVDEVSLPTFETLAVVHELTHYSTMGKMLSVMGMSRKQIKQFSWTQSQIIGFVREHRNWLGEENFFLFSARESFFVANVYRGVKGPLEVCVIRFESNRYWYGDYRPRVVIPQIRPFSPTPLILER